MDPMTLVIQTNNMGEIVKVFTDLPLTIVKVDGSGKGGTLERSGGLASMVDDLVSSVERILDPFGHLTSVQVEHMQSVAVEQLVNDTADGGFRRGFIRGIVEKMSVRELLDEIMGDESEDLVPGKLGFDPWTGEDVEADDYQDRLVWVLNVYNTWHWLKEADEPADRSGPRRVGLNACGTRTEFLAASASGVDVGDEPEPAAGQTVCQDCVDRMRTYERDHQ